MKPHLETGRQSSPALLHPPELGADKELEARRAADGDGGIDGPVDR